MSHAARYRIPLLFVTLAVATFALTPSTVQADRPSVDVIAKPYELDTGMTSRSISFENRTSAGKLVRVSLPLYPSNATVMRWGHCE